MIFTHPGSRISDNGYQIQKQQWKTGVKKKLLSYLLFGAINFTKLNYFIFEMLKKKIWANFQRVIELFTQKIVTKLSKIRVWDPGSGKNLFRIPDPGVKKASDPDPQHWKKLNICECCPACWSFSMSLALSSLPTMRASLVALVRVVGWKLPPPIWTGNADNGIPEEQRI
jgi:hypothetical protein